MVVCNQRTDLLFTRNLLLLAMFKLIYVTGNKKQTIYTHAYLKYNEHIHQEHQFLIGPRDVISTYQYQHIYDI